MPTSSHRIYLIDFIKFSYISMMVLYHCFYNTVYIYNHNAVNFIKYLLLVSGSFPFLSGYIAGMWAFQNLYSSYAPYASRCFSLGLRGVRLIIIYSLANLMLFLMTKVITLNEVVAETDDRLVKIIFGDSQYVIYDILLSLGLISVISATILRMAKLFQKHTSVMLLSVSAAIILATNTNYIFIACGLLGLGLGFFDCKFSLGERLQGRLAALASIIYIILFSVLSGEPKKEGLPYMLGVVLLFLGIRSAVNISHFCRTPLIVSIATVFARYSLMIYLVHVPLLVLGRMILQSLTTSQAYYVNFAVSFLLMMVSMYALSRLVDRLRSNQSIIDKLYKMALG